jgi:hypothetical protein
MLPDALRYDDGVRAGLIYVVDKIEALTAPARRG